MNVFDALERLTDPGVLRKVKVYSREQIQELQTKGEITPIEQIRQASQLPRVHVPGNSCRGSYNR